MPHVEELAQHYAAKVILLQVVEPAPTIVGSGGVYAYVALHQQEIDRWTEQVESYLAALQGESREKGIEAGRTLPMALSWKRS